MPFQKCKAALDAVELAESLSEEELSSNLADIVTQMALDVSYNRSTLDICYSISFHCNRLLLSCSYWIVLVYIFELPLRVHSSGCMLPGKFKCSVATGFSSIFLSSGRGFGEQYVITTG